MLLNTVACLNKQPDGQPLANKLLVYLINGKQCGERTGPDSMAEFDKAVSGDYVGISNQINNEQHPRKRPVDLAKIPHQMMEDIVHLTVKDGVVSGKSEGQGMVWENSGYLRDGVLVLAYRTAGSQGRGFGTHLLVNQDDRDVEVYAGYLEGRDCTVEAIIKYPYILVRGKPGSNEVNRAKIKYADMLKQHGALVDPWVCIQ